MYGSLSFSEEIWKIRVYGNGTDVTREKHRPVLDRRLYASGDKDNINWQAVHWS
jgi:hypothetical protein